MPKLLRIAKFGEDILNGTIADLLQVEDFSVAILTLSFDIDLSKVNMHVEHPCRAHNQSSLATGA